MGRLDAFYEIGFGGPWDVAAAALILEEAGGQVRFGECDMAGSRINRSMKHGAGSIETNRLASWPVVSWLFVQKVSLAKRRTDPISLIPHQRVGRLQVGDPSGGPFDLMARRVLGANGHLRGPMAAILQSAQCSDVEPRPPSQ